MNKTYIGMERSPDKSTRTRKRLVVNQRRYECACKRIADVNVTFCDKGGAKRTLKLSRIRKKVVATVSRRERVYKRTGEPSVPFCEKGGMTERLTDFSVKKNRNGA